MRAGCDARSVLSACRNLDRASRAAPGVHEVERPWRQTQEAAAARCGPRAEVAELPLRNQRVMLRDRDEDLCPDAVSDVERAEGREVVFPEGLRCPIAQVSA